MEWNMKATSWDLTEFDQQSMPSIDRSSGNNFGFSVDLKLGQVNNPTDSMNKWKNLGVNKVDPSSAGSGSTSTTKRARANSNGQGQTVNCSVDGCNSDLSLCKDYHRRHKVCELHSKTPEVTVGGQKQRFCQQCSRFHSLEEFDEGKRSCRKRLDGHNRRRRKAQPDPLSRSGNFLSPYQDTSQCLPFSTSLVYPSATLMSHSWVGTSNKADGGPRPYSQHQQLHPNLFLHSSSSSSSYKGEKQFSFLHGDNNANLSNKTSSETPICQPLLPSIRSSHNMFFDSRLTSEEVPAHDHSDCALSLLSNTIHHPLAHSLHNHLQPLDSVLVSSGRSNANVQFPPGMFEMGPNVSSPNEASQAHAFNWE
ncbi:hypothetical protein ACFE04_031679 [Oxalis oulophora]